MASVAAISKLSGFVIDMAAILTQVRRDSVGARLDGDQRGADRIGRPPAARVAHGRDMVDVDAEA
jgi:hypothetical protein